MMKNGPGKYREQFVRLMEKLIQVELEVYGVKIQTVLKFIDLLAELQEDQRVHARVFEEFKSYLSLMFQNQIDASDEKFVNRLYVYYKYDRVL